MHGRVCLKVCFGQENPNNVKNFISYRCNQCLHWFYKANTRRGAGFKYQVCNTCRVKGQGGQYKLLCSGPVSTQHPYLVELWVDLHKDYGSRVIRDKSVECECKTGESGKCKHIIAVMLNLARIEEENLEDLTGTDIEQQWGSLKASSLAEYQAKLTSELCHVNDPKLGHVAAPPQITNEMKKTWKDILLTSKHKLLTFNEGQRNSP